MTDDKQVFECSECGCKMSGRIVDGEPEVLPLDGPKMERDLQTLSDSLSEAERSAAFWQTRALQLERQVQQLSPRPDSDADFWRRRAEILEGELQGKGEASNMPPP